MRSAIAAMMLVGCALACSSSTQPPDVASAPGGFGGSTPYPTPCPSSSSTGDDAGNFNFEAGLDAGLGIGTTNPTTPPDGGTAFSGDATTTPAGDSGTPCR
jgi:hypothetical protein